jgi:Spy/CpxP family protein refolding chaperone
MTPMAALPRPAERTAIISLLLVFLCGAVLGALAMSYWSGHHGTRASYDGMTMSIQEWKEKLDLTDEQTRQLTSILDDFSRYFSNLVSDGNTRIVQILNADQKLKYERMMAEHKKRASK